MSTRQIGFIGLGIMGKPMALNLIKAGYSLVVNNRSNPAIEELVAAGAEAAKTAAEVASKVDLVLTMLPNSPDVEDVVLGKNGVIQGAKADLTIIDMSSISPLVTRNIGIKLKEKNINMLDAPVSGGEEKAKSGNLAFMVGGPENVFKKYKEVLEKMGASITLVGELGAGNIAKLANQSIVAVNIAVIAEALCLAKKLGVNPERIVSAIQGGLAGSSCLNDKTPRMLKGNYEPGFKMKLHAKDLGNIFSTSHEAHVHMPLTAQVMEMMQGLLAEGHTELDHGGLAMHYEKVNKLSLKSEA